MEIKTIDSIQYCSVNDFARAVHRSTSTIYHLVTVGNKNRRLHSIKIGQTVLIEVSEIKNFDFRSVGRG